jgi:hypothetical protein
MGLRIPSDVKIFKTAFLPVFLFFSVSCFCGAWGGFTAVYLLVTHFITHDFSLDFIPASLLTSVLVALAVAPIGSWFMGWGFPYGFSSAGVYGYNFWGIRRLMPWRDIQAVRPFPLFNLLYLRLIPADGREAVWLAFFPRDRAEFRGEFSRLVPLNRRKLFDPYLVKLG